MKLSKEEEGDTVYHSGRSSGVASIMWISFFGPPYIRCMASMSSYFWPQLYPIHIGYGPLSYTDEKCYLKSYINY